MSLEDVDGLMGQLKTVDQNCLNAVVDEFLFFEPRWWIDGYIFKIVVILNAIGVKTFNSCEGHNPMHKRVLGDHVRLPSIAVRLDDKDWVKYGRTIDSPGVVLNTLLEEFYADRVGGDFKICLRGDDLKALPDANGGSCEGLTVEHHGMAVREFDNFMRFLCDKFCVDGVSFDIAIRASMGDESLVSGEEDLPRGVCSFEDLRKAVEEYRAKGFEDMTVLGVIARTVAKYNLAMDRRNMRK